MPLKLNILQEAELMWEQLNRLINVIYENQVSFCCMLMTLVIVTV